ncbi:MAG: hypothetical protein ACXVGB_11485 [Mycobacteriaceae bacterium]
MRRDTGPQRDRAVQHPLLDAALTQLRAAGHDVRDEDVARLSPFVRHRINMMDRYSFQLLELPDGLRPLSVLAGGESSFAFCDGVWLARPVLA